MVECNQVTTRQINLALLTLATVLGVSAAAVLVVGIATPLEIAQGAQSDNAIPNLPGAATHTIESYEVIWSRPLRDAPANQVQPAAHVMPAPDNQPQLTLVGTIGNSLAILKSADGNVQVRAVGESFAGAQVMTIQPSRVQVRFNGRIIELIKPRSADQL